MSGPSALFQSLGRTSTDPGLDRLAADVVARLMTVEAVDHAGLIAFGPGELAVFLAVTGSLPSMPAVGSPLPRSRARYLRQRSRLGVWIERWVPRPVDGAYAERLAIDGMTAAVYVPLRSETAEPPVPAVLVAATTRPDGAEQLERRLSILAEFGLVVSPLVTDALAARGRTNSIRAEIMSVIRRRAFRPVFQPIVELDSGEMVALEALTRFADGMPPQRRFGEAETVGLGLELEIATLELALEAVRWLPPGIRLNVNVSPQLVMTSEELRGILGPLADRVTLELTEQQRVDDYRALRRAVARLPSGIRWAIDDAGAGFASLRHIIELRPQEVKVDRAIVKGIERDPIRQSVFAGLTHFAAGAGCRLIAEGVETTAERDTLLSLGVVFGQGHLYAEPAPAPEFGLDQGN